MLVKLVETRTNNRWIILDRTGEYLMAKDSNYSTCLQRRLENANEFCSQYSKLDGVRLTVADIQHIIDGRGEPFNEELFPDYKKPKEPVRFCTMEDL